MCARDCHQTLSVHTQVTVSTWVGNMRHCPLGEDREPASEKMTFPVLAPGPGARYETVRSAPYSLHLCDTGMIIGLF